MLRSVRFICARHSSSLCRCGCSRRSRLGIVFPTDATLLLADRWRFVQVCVVTCRMPPPLWPRATFGLRCDFTYATVLIVRYCSHSCQLAMILSPLQFIALPIGAPICLGPEHTAIQCISVSAKWFFLLCEFCAPVWLRMCECVVCIRAFHE